MNSKINLESTNPENFNLLLQNITSILSILQNQYNHTTKTTTDLDKKCQNLQNQVKSLTQEKNVYKSKFLALKKSNLKLRVKCGKRRADQISNREQVVCNGSVVEDVIVNGNESNATLTNERVKRLKSDGGETNTDENSGES